MGYNASFWPLESLLEGSLLCCENRKVVCPPTEGGGGGCELLPLVAASRQW